MTQRVDATYYLDGVKPVYERTYATFKARDEAGRSSMPIDLEDYATLAVAAHDVVIFAQRIESAESYLDQCVKKLENVDIAALRAILRDPAPATPTAVPS